MANCIYCVVQVGKKSCEGCTGIARYCSFHHALHSHCILFRQRRPHQLSISLHIYAINWFTPWRGRSVFVATMAHGRSCAKRARLGSRYSRAHPQPCCIGEWITACTHGIGSHCVWGSALSRWINSCISVFACSRSVCGSPQRGRRAEISWLCASR